jgi:hypothetical protein
VCVGQEWSHLTREKSEVAVLTVAGLPIQGPSNSHAARVVPLVKKPLLGVGQSQPPHSAVTKILAQHEINASQKLKRFYTIL